MAFMKATAKEISKYYYRLFKLDHTKFYYEFMGDAPLMIYAILITPILRDSFPQNNVVYKKPHLRDSPEKSVESGQRISMWSSY